MSDFCFSLEEITLKERPVVFRMPFRFGIVTLREAPEAHVTARIRLPNGATFTGKSADLMAPKWFDKNPELSNAQNFEQLRQAIHLARAQYLGDSNKNTAFGHHAMNEADHYAECKKNGLNGLVAGFGTAMVDRAILDATCKANGVPFFNAIRTNLSGITSQTATELDELDISAFLSTLAPARQIKIRHTVGLTDAITEDQVKLEDGASDGLPRSLSANCSAYGLRAFKLKVSGDADVDIARLGEIASVLDALPTPYLCSLDGNEQYNEAAEFGAFWAQMIAEPSLTQLTSSIAFFEQPIARSSALNTSLGELGDALAIEIDESDGDIDAFPIARSLGYRGVSSKSCKGVYRSLLNRCRVEMWNVEFGQDRYFMSAEDLCTQAGTALQQDLALATLIGCNHVERNGHQYGDGLSGCTQTERDALVSQHPDLYSLASKRTNLIIKDGKVSLNSLF